MDIPLYPHVLASPWAMGFQICWLVPSGYIKIANWIRHAAGSRAVRAKSRMSLVPFRKSQLLGCWSNQYQLCEMFTRVYIHTLCISHIYIPCHTTIYPMVYSDIGLYLVSWSIMVYGLVKNDPLWSQFLWPYSNPNWKNCSAKRFHVSHSSGCMLKLHSSASFSAGLPVHVIDVWVWKLIFQPTLMAHKKPSKFGLCIEVYRTVEFM